MAVSAEKIVSDCALFLERLGGAGVKATFYDEAVLPYPKQKILESIEAVISCESRDARVDALKVMAVWLADFQSGVGSEPFDESGLTPAQWEQYMKLCTDGDGEGASAAIANAPYRDRAERLKKIRDEEAKLITARLEAVSRLREKRPRGLFGFLR